jgi:signal transduction histidine kinase
MTSMPEHSMLSGTDDPDQPPGYPFRGPGLLVRVAPFAAIAVLAEASLALPPRPQSGASAAVSLVLLLAVAAAFALPWPRLPPFLAVLVPLAYCGSVLALILSMGATSGIGLVILVPLIWTALYQRRWESACVVVAIAAVELIISLTPVTAPGDVIARRVILWTALGTVIAFAAHELRDRLHRSRQEAARLQAGLTELTVLKDRDRIAADLQDKVIQQVFAAGLDLQGTALRANQPEVRERILASADDLDQVIRLIRNTIFGLDEQPQGRGLHAELRNVFSRLPAATEISFTGPVYGALDPVRATRLVQTLKDALEVISSYSMPARVAITTSDTAYVTEIETTSAVLGADEEFPPWVAGLTRSTSQTGISLSITPAPGRTRFAWSILLAGPAGQAPQPE